MFKEHQLSINSYFISSNWNDIQSPYGRQLRTKHRKWITEQLQQNGPFVLCHKIPKLAGIYWALKKSVFSKETEIDNLEATNPNLKTSYKILQLFYPIYRKYIILG